MTATVAVENIFMWYILLRSKLASLFGQDKETHEGGNSSLTYTAPKEPRRKTTGTNRRLCLILGMNLV